MKKVLNKNNLIFILIIMTLFNLIMPTVAYAENVSINKVLQENISAWYMILRSVAIAAMLILVLVLTIKAAISRNASDTSLIKRMLGDWLIALLLVLYIHYFMIFAININENAVSGAEALGQSLSGMEEGQEISLYESTISKAYEVKFKPGTIGMILYMMLVYYTYKFALVYLKRYINVMVLILIAPITCCFHAFRKVLTGKGFALGKWFKEFIYNVFLQSLHALMYGTLVGLSIKFSNDTESFVGAIITMILFAVIFKVDKYIRKIFNSVGGNTAVPVSSVKSTADNFGAIVAQKTSDAQNEFGKDLTAKDRLLHTADMVKTKTVSGLHTAKDGLVEFNRITRGDYKTVSQEAINREQQKMDNQGLIGRTLRSIPGLIVSAPQIISNKVEDIKEKTKELKEYLENKKRKVVVYVNDLERDIRTIRSIPKVVKDIKKLPSLVMRRNPQTNEYEYDNNFDAIFDRDITKIEIQRNLKTLIDMSSGDITSSVVMARGYETVLRCPQIGMAALAEENYKDMMHPEIPMENRRVVTGYKKEVTPTFSFNNFENGAIQTILKVMMSEFSRANAYMRSLTRLAVGVQNKTLTFRHVSGDVDKTVIHYKGKSKARRTVVTNAIITMQRVHSFIVDAQMAMNINLLNQLKRANDKVELTNLSPEMLKMLEDAGMIIRVEGKGNFKGGYIVLNQAIDNVRMNQRINDFLINNQDNPLAQKINQFLLENPNNLLALKISDYAIDNPDSVLAGVMGNIIITEDGQLLQKIEGFGMDGEKPNFAQLGTVNENTIIQKIITEDGQIVEQIIDLQGNIIEPASDKDGNIIEFPMNENGLIIQTIVTPEGTLIQQVLSQDGASIQPIMFETNENQIQSLDNIIGVVGEVTALDGVIQIVNQDTGMIQEIVPEEGMIQIMKTEDGIVQIINLETDEVIKVSEDSTIQIVKPQDSTVQIIDLENNVLQTVVGEDAINVLTEQGIELTAEQREEFTKRDDIKKDLMGISQAVAVDLTTGETELIYGIDEETGILTNLVEQEITENVSEESSIGKLNDLLAQVSIESENEAKGLTDQLLKEIDLVFAEPTETDKKELLVMNLDLPETAMRDDIISIASEAFSNGDIMTTEDLKVYLDDEGMDKLSNFAKAVQENFVLGIEDDDSALSQDKNIDIIDLLEQSGKNDSGAKAQEEKKAQSFFDEIMQETKIDPFLSDEEKKSDSLLEAIEKINSEIKKDAVYETVDIQKTTSEKKSNRMEMPKAPKDKNKGKKASSGKEDDEGNKAKIIVCHITGAVNKPGKYKLREGSKAYEAVKAAGGFSYDADKVKAQEILNSIISEENKQIDIPRATEEKRDNKSGKIECYITGAVNIPGTKILEKGATVADLISAANRLTEKANRNEIELNVGKIVQLGYVLADQDHVHIPELKIEDIDKQKGIDTKLVERIILQEYESYRRKVDVTLEEVRTNKKTKKFLVDKISKALNSQKIKLTEKEVEERLDAFIDKKIKEVNKQTQKRFNNIANNMTVVRDDQIPGNSQEKILKDLFAQLGAAQAAIQKEVIYRKAAEINKGTRKEQRKNDIMAQIQSLMGAG